MYALNGVQTKDSYPNEPSGSNAILVCPGAVRVNIRTTIAEVTCQMILAPPDGGGSLSGLAGSWGPNVNLGRSSRSLDRLIEAIRFRSTTPGQPGEVDVEAMTAAEVS